MRTIAWKMSPVSGDANFDIDDDSNKGQIDLFTGKELTKIEKFNRDIEELIRDSGELTNAELFLWTLEQGHPPKHSASHLRKLKKQKRIFYEGRSPKIVFDCLNNEGDLVNIK